MAAGPAATGVTATFGAVVGTLRRIGAGRLAERLAALRAGGRTTVLVTHDLARAADLADEALILVRGRDVHRARRTELAPDALERAYLAALEAAAA